MRWKFAVLACLLAGCGGEPLNTPSGQPEATLEGVDPACFRNHLLNHAVNMGYSPRTSTDTMLIVGRKTRDTAASILLSTGMSGAPEERIQFTFVQLGPRTLRVLAQAAYVSNQGTGFEKSVPSRARGNDAANLEQLFRSIAGGCRG